MGDAEITASALAAGRGDIEAADRFIRATQGEVWRFVAHLTDPSKADDLTQETYLRALRGLRTYRGECDARLWLLAIARRTVADHIRRRYRRPVEVASVDLQGTEAYSDHAERVALRHLIRCLEPDRRTAFVLTQLLGLSYAETAIACDVPVGTVRSRVARAREDLVGWLTAADGVPSEARGGVVPEGVSVGDAGQVRVKPRPRSAQTLS